jgi:predicted nucleic acid-binding Zn ribbon protein
MPIYIYECGKCNTRAEYLVPSHDTMPSMCSNADCEAHYSNLKRVLDGQIFGVHTSKSSGLAGHGKIGDLEVVAEISVSCPVCPKQVTLKLLKGNPSVRLGNN